MIHKHQHYVVNAEELGISIGTGSLGRQANGAVTVEMGDTSVFVAVTAADTVAEGQTYFPLMVDYREKFAAAGRFPGGYFKREGRPSEKEILTSRLCDRPLRPLFPKGFMNEVQVVGFLLSADLSNDADILMVNGASAALMCSDIPWDGPIGCVRVGDIQGQLVVNPSNEQLCESKLDLVYVGNEKDMLMIEGSADQIPEARFYQALEFAHGHIQKIIQAQKELARMVGKPKRAFTLYAVQPEVLSFCKTLVGDRLTQAVFQDNKKERSAAVKILQTEAQEAYKAKVGEEAFSAHQVALAFDQLQEALYRSAILKDSKRVDGRGLEALRPLHSATGVLPRVHGSALFQRGETQTLVITTLGTSRDAQDLDGITGGAQSKSFIFQYNFPPFSVGEVGRFGSPGRREVGHGALAERSLLPVMPPEDSFPYAIRLVSEVLESNGSTSMASVCGGTLALMDAGVPILAPVAGISVGMVSECDEKGRIGRYCLLTDILGAEDHYGDMDFKIAGSREGITGFQLDLKVGGLPLAIAKEAIEQNRITRHKILEHMEQCIARPRAELREHAPRVYAMQIDPEKIGALIGPGGKNIKRITEVSGAQIDINEDNSGRLLVFANNQESLKRAVQEIELCTGEIEEGKIYRGVVRGVKDFGVFVECLPGKEGMVHVSELADVRIRHPEDVCKMGDEMVVLCLGADEKGRVRLSRKAAVAAMAAQKSRGV
jgi:polyribonucleotide nucleotidyltransferase